MPLYVSNLSSCSEERTGSNTFFCWIPPALIVIKANCNKHWAESIRAELKWFQFSSVELLTLGCSKGIWIKNRNRNAKQNLWRAFIGLWTLKKNEGFRTLECLRHIVCHSSINRREKDIPVKVFADGWVDGRCEQLFVVVDGDHQEMECFSSFNYTMELTTLYRRKLC